MLRNPIFCDFSARGGGGGGGPDPLYPPLNPRKVSTRFLYVLSSVSQVLSISEKTLSRHRGGDYSLVVIGCRCHTLHFICSCAFIVHPTDYVSNLEVVNFRKWLMSYLMFSNVIIIPKIYSKTMKLS